ncbi:hypothetical protein SAMN05192588_0745 [Nonlabens sp. Hel1_33_55]|uniref:hypothetical protein n=1 Tax=Nonlabens sp. Hel1_33_55 TaxID=1336802 RepID=UPI000875E571|nr:hypothetical protein [Nonlabens sp. Hel1_33_55]SCY01611.1 hypothetical protein SAMN05192588_0745 [Nonlabens sp. Hel1_33_55]
MFSRFTIISLIIISFTVGCKNIESTPQTEESADIAEPTQPTSQSQALKDDINVEDVDVSQNSIENDIEYYEDEENLEFVYEEFDISRVLNRLQLGELMENRSLEVLLAAQLREGDQLVEDVLETGDGTFDIYKLVDSFDNELAYFYYESDVIGTIEIIHSGGVPDAMIRPGLTYEELRNTYDNPIAYGSAIEARVFVHEGDVGFRMDTSYGIAEPIDLEDDTEILYIQF